jgi:hypothetical protein
MLLFGVQYYFLASTVARRMKASDGTLSGSVADPGTLCDLEIVTDAAVEPLYGRPDQKPLRLNFTRGGARR